MNIYCILRIPPLKFHFLAPLLHPFLAQSLPRSLPPSRRPCHAPFLPRLFPSSTLPPSTLPSSTDASFLCSVLASSLPPLTLSLPPSLHPSPCSLSHHHLAPSLPPSFSPSLPLFPLPPSPCSLPLPPSLPLSLPPSILPRSFPAPRCLLASCRVTQHCVCMCVYSVGELHWLLFRESPAMNGAETMAWSRYQQVARGYLGNAPPRRIRF